MWLVAAMAPTGFGRLVAVGVLPGHLTAMLQGTGLNRHTCVFGIDITSTTAVEPDKHILVAAALAELLDNDGDGVVDSPPVVQAMVAARVLVAIYGSNKERRRASMSGKTSLPVTELLRTDVTVEGSEVLGRDSSKFVLIRMLLEQGLSPVYPAEFSVVESHNSQLQQAMKVASGNCGLGFLGQKVQPPATCSGHYHYNEPGCDFECEMASYFYLALTSVMGAQRNRCRKLSVIFAACTPQKVSGQFILEKTLLYYGWLKQASASNAINSLICQKNSLRPSYSHACREMPGWLTILSSCDCS